MHPGGIKTAIARNATAAEGIDAEELAKIFDKKLASTTPEKAATIILEAVRKNKARVLVGADAKALDVIVRHHRVRATSGCSSLGDRARLMPRS